MELHTKFNNRDIIIKCNIPIKNENVSNRYISIDLEELKFNGQNVNIGNIEKPYLELYKSKVVFTAYNKEKRTNIEIDLTGNEEEIKTEVNSYHSEMEKLFHKTYSNVIDSDGVLLIAWNELIGFTIKNTNPFNSCFIDLAMDMHINKEKIFDKFKELKDGEDVKLRINDLLKIIA